MKPETEKDAVSYVWCTLWQNLFIPGDAILKALFLLIQYILIKQVLQELSDQGIFLLAMCDPIINIFPSSCKNTKLIKMAWFILTLQLINMHHVTTFSWEILRYNVVVGKLFPVKELTYVALQISTKCNLCHNIFNGTKLNQPFLLF